MKLSARNQIAGKIVTVSDGAVNGQVKVDIGGGIIVTSSITNEAIAELELRSGDAVTVIIKSTDVLIGK
jgi:molybdopterin-binding protein